MSFNLDESCLGYFPEIQDVNEVVRCEICCKVFLNKFIFGEHFKNNQRELKKLEMTDSFKGLKSAKSESLLSPKMKKSCGDPNFINYVFDPPSLKNIAMVAIAVKVHQYHPLDGEICGNTWDKLIESTKIVLQRIEKIPLPLSLKHEITNTIMSIEIEWLNQVSHLKSHSFERYDLNEFFKKRDFSWWTMKGTVDLVKLVKDAFDEVTNSEDIHYVALYKVACTFCMEEYVSECWSKFCSYGPSDINDLCVAYWTASMRNKRSPYHIKDMITASIQQGNLTAFKYFWVHWLTEEEKRSNIKVWILVVLDNINSNYPTDSNNYIFRSLTYIMCFLLTQLESQSEQREIFELYPILILSLFCHWPLQRYFLPTFTVMLDFLNEEMYVDLLISISKCTIPRNGVLREMWDITPPNLKKSYLNYLKTDDKMELICQLIQVGDALTINSILKDTTKKDKMEIIFRVIKGDYLSCDLAGPNSYKITIPKIIAIVSEEDCDWFKLDFMTNYGARLTHKLMRLKGFPSLYTFWDWACSGISLKKCNKFKKKYIYLKKVYMKLIFDEEYKHADEFLKWYFETEKEIIKFKKSFVYNDKHCKLLINAFSIGKMPTSWEHFQKFLNFSFHSSVEVNNAKNVFKAFVLQKKYMPGWNHEFNSRFLKWCNAY